MPIAPRLDALIAWICRSALFRELQRRWRRSRLWRSITRYKGRRQQAPRLRHRHVYETIIGNGRLWFKLQAPCWSATQAAGYMEFRFNGTPYTTADGHSPVTPFRLSDCSHHIANWDSLLAQLPPDWDHGHYRIERQAYSWCETLSPDCDCSRDVHPPVVCSDYGTSEDDRERSKSPNALRAHYIAELEASIERHEDSRRSKVPNPTRQPPTSGSASFVYPRLPLGDGADAKHADFPLAAVNKISELAAAGYYCSIHGRHHPYGDQPIRTTIASLNAACEKMTGIDAAARRSHLSHLASVAEHYLQRYQAEECARRAAWGHIDLPNVLYKYMPRELIQRGAPRSLRATQLLALNDDMECNVITMKDLGQPKLEMLRALRYRLNEHLGIDIQWEDLLVQALNYRPRLSLYIQKYLNPLVGVVSFTTDPCVPTMWAHYARNTGIVVGYDTATLRSFGFELQPVIYSEIAPVYRPLTSDHIELDFVDREHMERLQRTGREQGDLRILTRAKLATLGSDWKSLSRLLFVKGMSWTYENEVRLLVDFENARDTGTTHQDWPVKVIDLPPEAVVEICAGPKTPKAVVENAVRTARGGDKSGLLVQSLSSDAFQIRKSYATRL